MQLKEDHIPIKPEQSPLRAGWFTPAMALVDPPEVAEAQAWENTPLADDADWVW